MFLPAHTQSHEYRPIYYTKNFKLLSKTRYTCYYFCLFTKVEHSLTTYLPTDRENKPTGSIPAGRCCSACLILCLQPLLFGGQLRFYRRYHLNQPFFALPLCIGADAPGHFPPIWPLHGILPSPSSFSLSQASAAPVAMSAPPSLEVRHSAAYLCLGNFCGSLQFADTTVNFSCGLSLHIVRDMGIDVQCGSG